ncbi:hypothetical protein BGZ79_000165 [Entomortierella chlamydospora]|nr:hypothetical protein BGZ79_000165 [Entomortierella chlamydospora]
MPKCKYCGHINTRRSSCSCSSQRSVTKKSSQKRISPYKRQSVELSDTENETESKKSTKTDLMCSDQEDDRLSVSDDDECSVVSKTESVVEADSAASKFVDDVAEPTTHYHLPERMCMPKTAYLNACRICLDFPKATSSDRCYSIENSEPTMLTKEVPSDKWCTPKNAKELNCTRCLKNINSNFCMSFARRYRRDIYPMEERAPSDVAAEKIDDIVDYDNTLTSNKNQRPPKDKDKVSIETMPNSSKDKSVPPKDKSMPPKDKSVPPKDKTFMKAAPGTATKESEATLQEFWGSFIPRTFMESFSSDDYDIAAGFVIIKKKK